MATSESVADAKVNVSPPVLPEGSKPMEPLQDDQLFLWNMIQGMEEEGESEEIEMEGLGKDKDWMMEGGEIKPGK